MGTSAEVVEAPGRDLYARARELLSELRNQLATVRTGAELRIRSDLSELQTKRVARNMFAATLLLVKFSQSLLRSCAIQGPHIWMMYGDDQRGISIDHATTLP